MADDYEVIWPRTDQDGNGVRGGRLCHDVASRPDTRWLFVEGIGRGDVQAVRNALPKGKRGAGWDHYRLQGPRLYGSAK